MKKIIAAITGIFSFFVSPVYAHCPLCTGAIAVAAASASYYGVSTAVIGVFVGGFAISTGLWVARKIKTKLFRFQDVSIVLLSFLLTVIPLMAIESEPMYFSLLLIGEPGTILNNLYSINQMLFGSIIGAAALMASFWIHVAIKNLKGGVLFPYQGIVISLALIVFSGTLMGVLVG